MTARKTYGSPSPFYDIFPEPIEADRDPTANDKKRAGQLWINLTTSKSFTFIKTSFFPISGISTSSTLMSLTPFNKAALILPFKWVSTRFVEYFY